jgi:ABC-type dipeptide/oligopeptide/nickel transport system permease subunit
MGVQKPTPSWGNIVNGGQQVLADAWWVATFPGLCIVFVVVSFNLVGDALRDALDPKLRE